MAKLVRTFSYLVSNPTDQGADVVVSVKAAPIGRKAPDPMLRQINHPKLLIDEYWIMPHDCGLLLEEKRPKARRELALTLEPQESVELLLVVRIKNPLPGKQAVQAFHIIETRAGTVTGGITVVVAAQPDLLTFTPVVEPNPTPLELAGPMVATTARHAGDGSETKVIAADASDTFLGVVVRNSGQKTLTDIEFHPESSSSGTIVIDPVIFQVAKLDPGESFFAATPADVSRVPPGEVSVTFKGTAQGFGPIRLDARIRRLSPGSD
jgi:hypothetical protein